MAFTLTLRSPKPNEKRASFSILKKESVDGRRKTSTIKHPDLDRINEQYKAGTLTLQDATILIRDLKDRIASQMTGHVKNRKPSHADNLKILEAYWDKEYSFRDLVDKDTAWHGMLRALKIIGDLPLMTAEQWQLQKKIAEAEIKTSQKRRATTRLNQLLKFIGRDIRLRMPKQEFHEIKYLTFTDMEYLARSLSGNARLLVVIAFTTGLRLGEIFALTEESIIKKGVLKIDYQIRKNLKRAPTKVRRGRRVAFMNEGEKAIYEWISIPINERFAIRRRNFANIIYKICKRLWPDRKEKWIIFHDLRHSFAIEMLRRGASLTEVAQLLGNGIQVCQQYYAGYSMTDENIDALIKRLKS